MISSIKQYPKPWQTKAICLDNNVVSEVSFESKGHSLRKSHTCDKTKRPMV